ncbi:MAG: hypothetical protein ACIRZ1_07375 [Ligilactobacillus ruminis]
MENRSLSIQRIVWYLAIATAFAFVVPILFTTDVHRIGIILFGIYVVYAVVVGLYAGKSNEHFWVLLFFPILYLIGYRFFFDGYARYFTVVYLGLSFAAYGITKD